MFTEPTINWVPSGYFGYIWFDTKLCLKKVLIVIGCLDSVYYWSCVLIKYIVFVIQNQTLFHFSTDGSFEPLDIAAYSSPPPLPGCDDDAGNVRN